MRRFMSISRPRVLHVIFAVLLFSAGGVCGNWYARAAAGKPAAKQPPASEALKYGDTDVVVARSQRATSEEVKLPFYRGAEVLQSYTYRVSSKQGKLLSYYAMALLASRDAPEKVAQDYSQRLPGKPKPEKLKDKSGARLVLAVASDSEVRSVTITQSKTGSDIRLTRAIKHTQTLKLPTPEMVPPGPGRRMGPDHDGPAPRPRRQRPHQGTEV